MVTRRKVLGALAALLPASWLGRRVLMEEDSALRFLADHASSRYYESSRQRFLFHDFVDYGDEVVGTICHNCGTRPGERIVCEAFTWNVRRIGEA